MVTINDREGRLEVHGGSIWYRVLGDGDGIPLIVLHGGPGYPSASLEPLTALATGRSVVFYDQLGCGNSDRPDEVSLWTVERYVNELARLVEHLEFEKVDLLGHSWGTMLAVDFYLAHPEVVRSMILASPALSAERWTADCERLISELPPDLRAVYADQEASEEDIDRLNEEFKKRHLYRPEDEHEARKRAAEGFGLPVYHTMWGPNEFTPTGLLKEYDRTGDLPNITVPVLYLCGRHDEATPESTSFYASLTPNSKVEVFEDSAHFAPLEQTEAFVDAVEDFLASVD